jgi:hypothetical protein
MLRRRCRRCLIASSTLALVMLFAIALPLAETMNHR